MFSAPALKLTNKANLRHKAFPPPDFGYHYTSLRRYHICMKPPPDNPEFARFTKAMRTIMGVSKAELQRRIEEEKKEKRSKPSASPGSVSSSTSAN
jgi:hypothetical protein